LTQQAFAQSGKFYSIKKPFRENIEFLEQDIRVQLPEGCFHVIFCRNLVFTYFEEALQREILSRILERLYHGGILVVGIHESIPKGVTGIIQYEDNPGIYKKSD
jgi:chemotaxis protein methyltransferase CheR